jgi:hypothetical protein
MKTQINNLRSGNKNQITNPLIDCTNLPSATSHNGHAGTNINDVEQVWEQVKLQHPHSMKVLVKGMQIDLTANWSVSGKSVSYSGVISNQDLEDKFYLKATKNKTATISIQHGNIITVSNGKNSYVNICPSLITIL